MPAPFIAATASPRRHRILADLGVAFEVFVPECPEIHDVANPVRTVSANALAKHDACARTHPDAWILAADTVVAFGGNCVGKPASPEDAHAMLLACSGITQEIFTAVALSAPGQAAADLRIVASSVTFRALDAATVAAYLAAAKTLDRAGGYDIATKSEAIIASHSGSYTNIMGLPGETVRDWLLARHYPLPQNRASELP
ncbi:MAG: Maf family protein [Kiritimatiellia bacterium]|jgi:septum formation protein